MPKPTTVATWATSGPITVPTSGKKAAGFSPQERPAAQYLNWLSNIGGQWQAWLDGIFGTDGSLTLDVNASVIVSGTGKFKRGTRVRHIPGSAGQLVSVPTGGTQYYSGDNFQFRASGNIAKWNLILEEGEQLQSVRAYVACGTTDVLTMKVFKTPQTVGSTANVDLTQLGSTQTSAGQSSLIETLTVSGLTENVSSGIICYSVTVQCTAFATAPFCAGIDYTTTIP